MVDARSLTLTPRQCDGLFRHLFPGDEREAAAILVCGHVGSHGERLIVRETILVPHSACAVRTSVQLSWPGEYLEAAIDEAEARRDAIILLHSHPGGFFGFSRMDNESDAEVIPCLHHAFRPRGGRHGSAVMTPDGRICCRLYDEFKLVVDALPVHQVGVNLRDLHNNARFRAPFGDQMRSYLVGKTVCVVGVSGTGSVVAEILARDSVGHLILIDPDVMKLENLNRILNSTLHDVEQQIPKPYLTHRAVSAFAPHTKVTSINKSIRDPEAIRAASAADAIFSCVDSMEGRMICERLCRCCLIPLIDVGVTIPTRVNADGSLAVADVCGRIDYVHPDGSSLTGRGVVTASGLRSEYLFEVDPNAAEEQVRQGYITGVHEEAPSVMFLNMHAASLAIYEWYARMFQLRMDGNEGYARTSFSLFAGDLEFARDDEFDAVHLVTLADGLVNPLLGLPGLEGPIDRSQAA